MNRALEMPARDGETVTQWHADYCRDNGHAKWSVNSEERGICPRCGVVTVPAKTKARSPERAQFLGDLLTTAIEHMGYGFPETYEYVISPEDPAEWFAVIGDRYDKDSKETYRVTIETMAHGIGVMRQNGYGNPEFWVSDRTNAEDGDFDVCDALAVLESALFGKVVYC